MSVLLIITGSTDVSGSELEIDMLRTIHFVNAA